jgi:hypothetical protein
MHRRHDWLLYVLIGVVLHCLVQRVFIDACRRMPLTHCPNSLVHDKMHACIWPVGTTTCREQVDVPRAPFLPT